MYLRKFLPYFLKKRLWGDRDNFGLVVDENDPSWKEWNNIYTKFYKSNQRGNIGVKVNDIGYSILKEIDLENKSTLTRKEIIDISINKNVNFHGKVLDMKKIYSKTDIVVLPSWREGLSKSLIEAASMSLPIITTDVPGCKEIIENKKSGILIPLKNKFLLKKAIKKLHGLAPVAPLGAWTNRPF